MELTKQELVELLSESDLFNHLNNEETSTLLKLCEFESLTADEVLFYKDEPSDSLYIVTSGKCLAVLEENGVEKLIGTIGVGEMIGELGALSGKPRALTIKAYSDSTLLKLTSEHFIEFLENSSSTQLYLKLFASIIERSQQVIKILAKEKVYRHIALIPATDESIPDNFIEQLKDAIKPQHNLIIIDRDALQQKKSDINLDIILEVIRKADKENKIIVFIVKDLSRLGMYADAVEQKSFKMIMENLDAVYFVAKGAQYRDINKPVRMVLDKNKLSLISKKSLILLNEGQQYNNTSTWLDSCRVDNHYHIDMNQKSDYSRLLRYIIGRPNGLVLSGGGTKCYAALGAVKAFEELGIPIDAVGGTSAGSILAALIANYKSFDDIFEAGKPTIEIGSHSLKMKNLTFPLVSVANGQVLTDTLQEVYGDMQIEDTRLPFYAIGCDLNQGKELRFKRGPLWEAIRCSTSLPLIYPPYIKDGHLIIDGGLLNNLPIDVMIDLIGSEAFITAFNLSVTVHDEKYKFTPIMGFFDSMLTRLKLRHKDYNYPPLIEMFLNSLMLGSSLRANENSLKANLLIQPDLSEFPILGLGPDKIEELIEIGYQETMQDLSEIDICPHTKTMKKKEK